MNKAHKVISDLLLTDDAWLLLQARGFDPVYGARPVKRAVQRELETALAKSLLRGDCGEEDTVIVSAPGGAQANELVLKVQRGAKATNSNMGSLDDNSALPIEVQGL